MRRRTTVAALVLAAAGAPVAIALAADSPSRSAQAATSPKDRIETESGRSARTASVTSHGIRVTQKRAAMIAKRRAARRAAAAEAASVAAPQQSWSPPPPTVTTTTGGGAGGDLASIRACESGGNYSTDTGNGYGGAYQFDQQTWEAAGGSGTPAAASPAEQDRVAANWIASGHRSAWPNC